LLTGDTEKDVDYQQKAKENVVEIISYWHPNMTINLIDDHTAWQQNNIPPPLNECESILSA
jgi:aspartate carbamoyltransferase regulatory subunit